MLLPLLKTSLVVMRNFLPHPRCWFKLSQRSGGGEFVDLMSDASIPDRSILRVVVGKCKVSLKFSCSEVKTKLFRGLGVCAELLTNNLLKLVWCS